MVEISVIRAKENCQVQMRFIHSNSFISIRLWSFFGLFSFLAQLHCLEKLVLYCCYLGVFDLTSFRETPCIRYLLLFFRHWRREYTNANDEMTLFWIKFPFRCEIYAFFSHSLSRSIFGSCEICVFTWHRFRCTHTMYRRCQWDRSFELNGIKWNRINDQSIWHVDMCESGTHFRRSRLHSFNAMNSYLVPPFTHALFYYFPLGFFSPIFLRPETNLAVSRVFANEFFIKVDDRLTSPSSPSSRMGRWKKRTNFEC